MLVEQAAVVFWLVDGFTKGNMDRSIDAARAYSCSVSPRIVVNIISDMDEKYGFSSSLATDFSLPSLFLWRFG